MQITINITPGPYRLNPFHLPEYRQGPVTFIGSDTLQYSGTRQQLVAYSLMVETASNKMLYKGYNFFPSCYPRSVSLRMI